jgi:single-strand DNA-binding protein
MQKSSVNKVILVGHLGNQPEGRYTPSGTSTATFSLATNESWIDSDNAKQERTEWHNIIAWNKLADFATEYLQKGQLIYIEGRLQTRTYQDKEDIQRRITEIVSTVITPLEWKTSDKKENAATNKLDKQNTKDEKPSNEDGLPF